MAKKYYSKQLEFSGRALLIVLAVAYIVPQILSQDPPESSSPAESPSNSTAAPTNSTAAPNSTASVNLFTNCTVDKCIRCVDPIQITCADCDSGWYKRTFRGGNKSYDACWAIWKLVLFIIGMLLLACCCAGAMWYCRRRGQRGYGLFSDTDQKSPYNTYETRSGSPRVIRTQPYVVEEAQSPRRVIQSPTYV